MEERVQSPQTDQELCALAQQGSGRATDAQGVQEAEEALVCRYSRLVRICARPLFLAGGDSEDLIQEGMLGLLTAVRSYDPGRAASFPTFAEICIRSRLHSAIRAALGGKHTPLNDCISMETETPLFEGPNPFFSQEESLEDGIIHREEVKECLYLLRDQLSNYESSVLTHYLSGLTCREIAQNLGCGTKSVENGVQRIRKKLAQQVQRGVSSES